MIDFIGKINQQVNIEGEMLETTGKRLAALQRDLEYSNKDVVDYIKQYFSGRKKTSLPHPNLANIKHRLCNTD